MTDKRKTIWYVEINDGATNEAAMEYLSKTCDATQDKFVRIKDRGGTFHHLLQVERGFINLFERNQKKFNLFLRFIENTREIHMSISGNSQGVEKSTELRNSKRRKNG